LLRGRAGIEAVSKQGTSVDQIWDNVFCPAVLGDDWTSITMDYHALVQNFVTYSCIERLNCLGSNSCSLQQLEQSEQEKLDLQNQLKAAQGGETSAAQRVCLFLFVARKQRPQASYLLQTYCQMY
jgi:hypothetical protein